MNRRDLLAVRRSLFLLAATSVFAGILLGQTAPQSQSKWKKPKTAAPAHHAASDTVAPARADSLPRAHAVATNDSLRRSADSVASQKKADSLHAAPLRTIRNDAFGVGERLVFDVNYGFITAGEAVMQIASYDTIAGRKCFRVEFKVNSLPTFSWIYKVEDRYLTFIDVETIAPWKFEQHIREGGYSRDFIAEFDQVKNIAKTTEGNYPIPPYVHDIMSAFYYARTIEYGSMKVGDLIVLHNFYKDKTHELAVKVLGRQQLDIAAGSFNSIVVEPMVKEGGLFKSEGRIVIWLSDDERKIPLRVNTKVVIGSIDTELREYSGLRGPLRSRLK